MFSFRCDCDPSFQEFPSFLSGMSYDATKAQVSVHISEDQEIKLNQTHSTEALSHKHVLTNMSFGRLLESQLA